MTTRTLRTGIALGESARWHDGRLWFADWMAGEVIAVGEDGSGEVVLRAPSAPCCFDWLPDGRLLLVSGAERRVVRIEPDGSQVTHADLSHLTDHPLNEVVTDAAGRAYVNGIGFDMMGGGRPGPGLIAVVDPDGGARRVAVDLAFPNGMAIGADGTTLLVAESHGRRLTAFTITQDGGLADRRVWADLGDGVPDGICLDHEGAVWYADVPNRRCVRVAEGGEVLAAADADRGCFSCALGGADGRTLFIVAAEWGGPEQMGDGRRTGVLLAADVGRTSAGGEARTHLRR